MGVATAHVNGICGPYGCHCPFDYPLQSPNAQFLVTKRVAWLTRELPGKGTEHMSSVRPQVIWRVEGDRVHSKVLVPKLPDFLEACWCVCVGGVRVKGVFHPAQNT